MAKRETKPERLDRELGELLQELRVLLPGVQVLFAFLLTVPFSNRFEQLNDTEQALFLGALVCAAAASALLVAPSAFHRLRFRDRDKEWMIIASNRLAIAGTIFLAISMTSALFLVAEFIYGARVASVATVVVGSLFFVVWYLIPLVRHARD